jgi:hypothetical protein
MPPAPNPLDLLSDEVLFNTQLTLALGCGRAKSALKGKHKTNICFLLTVLSVEANNRGKPSPQPPYSA